MGEDWLKIINLDVASPTVSPFSTMFSEAILFKIIKAQDCIVLFLLLLSYLSGGTGVYLRIVFVVGLLGVLAHSVFHITLAAIATDSEPYGSMFSNCKSLFLTLALTNSGF